MRFTGDEDHSISLNDAAQLTGRYRAQMETSELKGGYFGRAAIISILSQTDCVGIRYYYGLDAEDKQVIVLVGVLANGDDMVEGELAEFSIPCPDSCGANNDLNS
ncbi:MAG TPA: hypothetical protein VJY62_16985 [Bacteroidia bacterium]|nr:hypothetical protein [Bacteroidia bacterium]